MPNADQPGGRIAARATLVALRAMLPNPASSTGVGYMMLPDTHLLDQETMITALDRIPKPVACVAIGVGGSLGIACWSKSDGAPAPDSNYLGELRRTLVELRQASPMSDGQVSGVLLRGYRESLTLTIEALERWWTDYHLILPSYHIITKTPEVRHRQLSGIIEYCSHPTD